MAGLHFEIDGTNEGLIRKLRESRQAIINSGDVAEQQGVRIENSFKRIAAGAATLGVGLSIKELITNITQVRGEFQKFEAVLGNTFNDTGKAKEAMRMISNFAASTPFQVDQLTGSFVKLANMGFVPTLEEMTKMGDLASSTGKGFDQLTEAIIDAQTGENERLKEFGIRASVNGNKVTYTFKEQATTVENTASAIRTYILSLGDLQGVQGANAKISATLTGEISNLSDKFTAMYNEIGQSTEGIISSSIGGVAMIVENYETIGKTILELAAVYGTYKAVLMSVAAYQSMAVGVTYAAEIAELSKLIPLKQQSANQDVIAAVASGKLTQSKAEQVIALRAEIAAKIQSLQATKIQAQAEFSSALASYKASRLRYTVAQEQIALAQSQMSIAIKSGTVEEIATAKKNAQTVSLELNNAAVAKNTAHKGVNIAATNSKSASEALNTLETGKNSVAQTVNTASTNILTAAKTKLAAASKALGLSMLTNPYVLAAVAVAGLGYAIYKTATAETEMSKATSLLNKHLGESTSASLSEQRELARLKGKLQGCKEGSEEYSKVKSEIISKFGKYDKTLTDETLSVQTLTEKYISLTKAIQSSFGARQYENFKKEQQDSLDKVFSKNLGKLQDRLSDELGDEAGSKIYTKIRLALLEGKELDQDVKSVLDKIQDKGTMFADSRADAYINNIREAQEAADNIDKKAKVKLGINNDDISKQGEGGSGSKGKEAEKKAASEWLSSYKKAYEDAEKAYNDFLTSKQVMSDADRDKELKRLKELRDTSKTTYESKGGSVSSNTKQSTQAANTAESLREQQEKYKLLLDKQSLDQSRSEQDLQNQVAQARIDATKDGFDKQQEQRDLNNKKEIQALERQKDDYIRAIIQAEKDKFDAQEDVKAQQKKGYVKQTFDTSTVSVDASVFDGIINNTSKKQLNDKVREQEDAWDEYIIKYGAFTQKKEAIDRKYKKLIDEAPDAGIAATLQKEWEEATANLDLSKLKQDMNWEMIFGDLSKVTKDQLKNIKKQLSEFKKSPEFQNATPEQIQVIEGAINSINNAMVDKGGFFGGMAKSVNELKIATEELKKAEEELAKANKSGTDAQKEEAQKKVNKAKNNQQNAETNVTKSGDKTIQHLTSVGDAIAQLGSSAEMSLSSFGNATGGIVDAFTEAGSKIGGLVGAIFSILDGIQQQGFDKFVGNILESVAGAALNVATFGLVKIGADYSHYNEMKEEYDELNEIWDELIDKKMEYIDISYGIEASKVGKEAEAIQQKAIDGYRTLGLERLNSGASAGSHSIGVRINNGMSSEGWEQAKTALGTTFDDLAIGDGRMTGMFDLTAKQLEKLKEEAPLFWAKLDDDVKGYLNKIIEGEDKIDEIQEKVKEQLTQTSFDNVFDSFMDTLMDMDSAAQDFAGDFEEYMKRAVLMNVMGPKLQKQLETWYENFSKDMDKKREKGKFLRPGKVLEEAGILTDEELKNRKEEWDKIVQDGIAERDALFAAMGFDSDPSREASKKGIATASQDSVDENNGRLTVIQGHTYSINETLKEIASFGRVIMSDCAHLPRLEDIGNNLRALTASQDIAIGHLSNIEKNTARLEAIENTMVSMNRGIQDMNTKGLTFRR